MDTYDAGSNEMTVSPTRHGSDIVAGSLRNVAATSSLPLPKTNSASPTTTNTKPKALQQQQTQQQQTQIQQQQQQHHQFRTPQQFVKQRKSMNSALSKKNKTWNKRQNKIGKQQQQQLLQQQQQHYIQQQIQQQQQHQEQEQLQQQQQQQQQLQQPLHQNTANATPLGGNNVIVGASIVGSTSSSINSSVNSSKADLENIQNLKSFSGNNNNNGSSSGGNGSSGHHSHHSHNHHHHSYAHHGHYSGAGHRLLGNSGAIVAGNNTVACGAECRNTSLTGGSNNGAGGGSTSNLHTPASLEKLCFSHGHHHLKQQLYKKVVSHRGHYHNHVLCAGAAHNSHGSGSSNGGVCCLLHGCPTQNNSKDKDGNGSHSSSNVSVVSAAACSALHYCCGRAKFFLPDKRLRKEIIVPPTKFLLGGNISDPLNLNSLQNETASNNTTPATTPRRSPITTPPKVEVIIPPNIHDPLHLLDPVDSMEYEKQLTSPLKRHPRGPLLLNKPYKTGRNRKNRKPKRRRHDSYGSVDSVLSQQKQHDTSGGQLTTDLLSFSSDAIRVQMDTSGVTGSGSLTVSAALATLSTQISDGEEHNSFSELTERNVSVSISQSAEKTGPQSQAQQQQQQHQQQLQQQHSAHVKESSGGEHIVGAAAEYVGPITRERANRDLRLELNSTSATNSTCGSTLSGSRSNGGRGRKRKISESNNSQKNKKHRDALDKIVSPVVPQPGAWKRPPRQAASGARKPSRRSTSVSESEVLSPAEEIVRSWATDGEGRVVITPDNSKLDTVSETGVGSPLSTISGSTSIATAEHEIPNETSANEFSADGSVNEAFLRTSNATTAGGATATTTITATIAATSIASTTAEAVAAATAKQAKAPKFREENLKYRYGNYDRYKGVRQLNEFIDVRLHIFNRNCELFQNKDILDIGCNTGQMTISVARDLAPKSILGIDIDKELIKRARRNLAMYVRIPTKPIVAAAAATSSVTDTTTLPIKKEKEEVTSVAECGVNVPSAAATKKRKNRKSKKQRLAAAARAASLQPATAAHLMHHHHLLHHHHHHYFHHLNNNWHPEQPHQQRLHVNADELFPVSFPLSFGGLDKFSAALTPPSTQCSDAKSPASRSTPGPPASSINLPCTTQANEFPRNVFFRQTNYVVKDESQLSNEAQQYDLILCLSVTKWIHLNFGDAGLKLAFKRMFNQLRPGGKLILEAQNWASYKKKSSLTEEIHTNYQTIEFFPNKFHEYLLSSEVGFSHSYTLGVPRHLNKGFGRPIQLYAKGDYTPNHVRWSDAYYPTTPFEEYRGIYAFMPPRSGGTYGWNYAKSSTRSQAYDTPHHVSGGASGPYSCHQTPVYHPTYNPLETDSYQPSYDMDYLNHVDVFGSPLYQTVWSPPASLRNSSSHTPVYGSVREAELDGDGAGGSGNYRRHVYPPNDDTFSPNANAGGAFNSIRDPDTDDSAGNVRHVYATNCGESSSSPQVLRPEAEMIEEGLMLDEDAVSGTGCGYNNEP